MFHNLIFACFSSDNKIVSPLQDYSAGKDTRRTKNIVYCFVMPLWPCVFREGFAEEAKPDDAGCYAL